MLKEILKNAALVLVALQVGFSQSGTAMPSFEAASVKRAAPQKGVVVAGRVTENPGRLNYSNVVLKTVILRAFGVNAYQVEGPDWLESERYDIIATIPPNTARELIPLMLQQLLADRYKLAVHRGKRELPVYALVVGKGGARLERAQDDAPGAASGDDIGSRGTIMMRDGRLEAKKVSLSRFADSFLSGLLERPVIDATGLEGLFNFVLEFSLQDPTSMRNRGNLPTGSESGGMTTDAVPTAAAPGSTIFSAIGTLGLKLESRRAPVDILVIEHAERVPTEN